ncbi:hypothetical protein [Aequorivita sp. Q41]|uniref:hypothetical protein n=1 Tax=Aequorivita sp. Q41 TaxID=3153300 RepID=UPI0032426CE5
MKKITLLLLGATLMLSCGKSKEEQLIADYAQTLGDAKMDLNFKMKNLEKVEDITAKDSLEILKSYFTEKKANKISEFQDGINYNKENLDKHTKELAETNPNHSSLVELYERYINEAKSEIERYEQNIKLYEGDCQGTFLEPVLISIKDYEKRGDEILVSKFKANFTMNNPLLNNTKQEITRTYYLDGDRTKVLSTESE